jgi:hypothetical protein
MSCTFLKHRCGVRGRTWAFLVSGNLDFFLVLPIPEDGEKANIMTEVLGKHIRLEVNTHTAAKSKQLKANIG